MKCRECGEKLNFNDLEEDYEEVEVTVAADYPNYDKVIGSELVQFYRCPYCLERYEGDEAYELF